MSTWTRSMLVTMAVLAVACGPGPTPADPDAGPERMRTSRVGPSMAACPPMSTLTYESFGEAFFTEYCTRCHASTLTTPTARSGAPPGYDFDTHAGVMMHLAAIDAVAAAGPMRINVFMPLGMPVPSDAERDLLGEWIACGAP